jgi:ketosteroid isomerase-like protein
MKAILLVVLCTAAACGGAAPADLPNGARTATLRHDDDDRRVRGREALFAADAAHTALIRSAGPVEGLVRGLAHDALYLIDGIDVVQGRKDISAILAATIPAGATIDRTLVGGDASADGRFGFTFGWILRTGTGGATANGTYVATWTRPDDDAPFRVSAYYTRLSASQVRPPDRAGFPLLLDGAGAAGTAHRGEVKDQEHSLLAADAQFAARSVAAGFTIAFGDYANAFAMPFGGRFLFLEGKDEVLATYAGWTPQEVLDWTPAYAGASESGDLGFTVGRAVDAYTNPDGTTDRFYSKYLTIWVRQADGAWRFLADGGTTSPAPEK